MKCFKISIGGLLEQFFCLKIGVHGQVRWVFKTYSISAQNCTPATFVLFSWQLELLDWREEPRLITAFITLLSFENG